MGIRCYKFKESLGFWDFVREFLSSEKIEGNVALSGGSAAKIIGEIEDLSKFTFWQVDERWANKDSKFSNEKLLKEMSDGRLDMRGFEVDLEKGMKKCLEEYVEKLPNKMDLIVLGVGPDGHIGSIFPGYEDVPGKAIITETSEFDVDHRLSLGMDYIVKADKILVLLQGESKADIYDRICRYDEFDISEKLPIDVLIERYDGNMQVVFKQI